MNKFAFLAVVLASFAFGATGDMDKVTGIIADSSSAYSKSYGIGITWFFAVIFPLACLLIMGFIGYTMAKKKVEQSNDGQGRIPGYIFAGVVIGGITYTVVTAIIFSLLTGDAGNAAVVVNQFYKNALGI